MTGVDLEKPTIIPSWRQGGERFVNNISPTGQGLELPFTDNSLYGKLIWQQISVDTLLRHTDWHEVFGNSNPVNMEIGIGNGAFIAHKADAEPDENWVGMEVFKKVFNKAALKAKKNVHNNLRVIHFDAALILRLAHDNSLKSIYVNFPDPWPKTYHKRRRLLKPNFLSLCSSKLIQGGVLHIATDHEDYAMEITKNIAQVNTLASMFPEPYLKDIDDYFPTKYYKKFATKVGAYFFRYHKIDE